MPDDLSGLLKSINKELKGAVVIQAIADIETAYDIRRPNGILSLDLELNGGWPAGTINQIHGPDGVGKDLLTNYAMAENQRIHGDKSNIFWTSFGYKPDLKFMRMCDVQIAMTDSELLDLGIDPATATKEQRGKTVGNIIFIDISNEDLALEQPAETILTSVLRMVASNKFQLGIINELASGETGDNVVKGLHENARMATWASLMSDFCRKYYSTIRLPDSNGKPNATCILVINPVRANLDAYSAKFTPHTQPSGYALKHAKAVDLHLKPAGFIKAGANKVGKKVNWKIMKGKHGISEGAEGEYDIYFMKGIDLIADLANTAKAYGAVRNKGKYFYILDYEDRIEGGINGVTAMLRKNSALADEVRKAVLKTSRTGEIVDYDNTLTESAVDPVGEE